MVALYPLPLYPLPLYPLPFRPIPVLPYWPPVIGPRGPVVAVV